MPSPERLFDALVFIGRLQPLHIGHKAVIDRALERAHQVVILIGSANEARSIKNPFTYEERAHMVESLYRYEVETDRIVIMPIGNHGSDDRWVSDVRQAVQDAVGTEKRVGITGFTKDASSSYLDWFPEWILDLHNTQIGTFNATDVRHGYFARSPSLPTLLCPMQICDFLRDFHGSEEYARIAGEKAYLDQYAALWQNAPFNKEKPHMLTADAVVTQNKKVLLVRRGDHPGKGLLALPGGYLDPKDYSLRACAVRELKEETRLSDSRGEIPAGRLDSFIRDSHVFDEPDRDLRGRVVTQAFRFELPDSPVQYTVKGGDDAASADWHLIGPDLDPTQFYADHYHILAHFFKL
jgi:bifunctional NMN adenylyltransferase/nudix hydrolase